MTVPGARFLAALFLPLVLSELPTHFREGSLRFGPGRALRVDGVAHAHVTYSGQWQRQERSAKAHVTQK